MIKVLIADDHPLVRRGVRQIISDFPDIEMTGEAGSGSELMTLIQEQTIDVVLLDISMPGRDGLEILKQIKQEFPTVYVLMLSIYPEEQYAIRALKAGAAGYLTKAAAPDELVIAIRKIAAGGRYVTSSLAEKLAANLLKPITELPHKTLSDREYQVFLMLSSGRTVSEIAVELSLSDKTISTYRSRLIEKMGMKTNAELAPYAIMNTLID